MDRAVREDLVKTAYLWSYPSLCKKSLADLRENLKVLQQELYRLLCIYIQSREQDKEEAKQYYMEYQFKMVPSDFAICIFKDYFGLKHVNIPLLKKTPATPEDSVIQLPRKNLDDSDNEMLRDMQDNLEGKRVALMQDSKFKEMDTKNKLSVLESTLKDFKTTFNSKVDLLNMNIKFEIGQKEY